MNFAASGEAEKMAWTDALAKAAGQRQSNPLAGAAGRPSVRAIGAARAAAGASPGKTTTEVPIPSVASPVKPPAVAAAPAAAATSPAAAAASLTVSASPPLPSPGKSSTPVKAPVVAATQVASSMGSQAANEKLKQKLEASGIKIGGGASTQTLCTVCGLPVYKMEELIVDKAIMHKRCFQCAHCKRQLTLGNFAAVNKTLYCKVHYFELFSTNGGKYDKAFGDAGFEKKAQTSFIPGQLNVRGGVSVSPPSSPPIKTTAVASPLPPTATKAAPAPAAKAAADVAPTPQSTPAKTPGRLVIKAPESTVDKAEKVKQPLEGLEQKRDMKSLMEKVAAGMAGGPVTGMPPPKKTSAAAETADDSAPAVAAALAEHPTPEGEAANAPKAEDSDAQDAPADKPATDEDTGKEDRAANVDDSATLAAKTEPVADTPAEEELPQGRPTVRGPNFALEAMRIRQAQLENRKSTRDGQSPRAATHKSVNASHVLPAEDKAEPESSVPDVPAGALDNQAALSKPKIAAKRRAPKVTEVSKLLPKAEIDRMTSDFTLRISVDGSESGPNVLWVHATSQFERDHWVETLAAAIHRLGMQRDLEQAQKTDMMSALACQMALEEFLRNTTTTYAGFMEKLSLKSHRNWKKRYFELNDKGQLAYFENENSKKAKQTLQLTYNSIVSSAAGQKLNVPIVVNTGAAASEEPGQLPDNIAVFDGMDVTMDLNTIVADVPEDVALEDLAKIEFIAPQGDDGDALEEEDEEFEIRNPNAPSSPELAHKHVNMPADYFATTSPGADGARADAAQRKKGRESCVVM